MIISVLNIGIKAKKNVFSGLNLESNVADKNSIVRALIVGDLITRSS